MTRSLVIPGRVERELRTIVAWYRTTSGSSSVAQRWHDGIVVAIRSLARRPRRGSPARENDRFDFDLFELAYGSGKRRTHRILYRFDDQEVRILAIRHVAQDDVTDADLALLN
jgi:plasmid stabilization system protein ParE